MKIFVTGASGFIGGSIAQYLRSKGNEIHGLVRDPAKAERLRERGITPVLGDLADETLLIAEAQRADAVVNAADSLRKAAVTALVKGLEGSGKPLVHTSGTGMLSRDVSGDVSGLPAISDDGPISPGDHPMQHMLRNVELEALTGADRAVRSVVISNPLIYGAGIGLNPNSVHVPMMVRTARASGVSGYLGAGANRWSTVHVEDMADLYWRALERAPAGSFYFAASGTSSFGEIAAAIARRMGLGEPQSLTIEEAAAAWGEMPARYLLGSESIVEAVRGRSELGWQPRHDSVIGWIERDMARD